MCYQNYLYEQIEEWLTRIISNTKKTAKAAPNARSRNIGCIQRCQTLRATFGPTEDKRYMV